MQRATTRAPLTTMQLLVADLLGIGLSPEHVASELRIGIHGVRFHVNRAAAKIPGDLPAQMKVIAWARGATDDVLCGRTLKAEVIDRSNVATLTVRASCNS